MLRQDEHHALGLSGEDLSEVLEGQPTFELTVERWPGTQTTSLDLLDFVDPLAKRFGLSMKPETLNLWADSPITLPDPLELAGTGRIRRTRGYFSPMVLEQHALGFGVRDERHRRNTLIQVFAHTWLRERLELESGDQVRVQFVPATALPGGQ